MLKYLIFISILVFILPAKGFSQSKTSDTTKPAISAVITFDAITKTTNKPIPFDSPFVLQVINRSFKSTPKTSAYEINGDVIRYIYLDKEGHSATYPDIFIKDTVIAGSLYLFFDPIRPNIRFDILLSEKLSDKNLDALFTLNKFIYKNINYYPDGRMNGEAESNFQKLEGNLNKIVYGGIQPNGFYESIDGYVEGCYNLMKPSYKNIMTYSFAPYTAINISEIGFMLNFLQEDQRWNKDIINSESFNLKLFYLYQLSTKNFNPDFAADLSAGLIPVYANNSADNCDSLDFKDRLSNLDTTLSIIDSTYNLLEKLYVKNLFPGSIESLLKDLINIGKTLRTNRAILKDNFGSIMDIVSKDDRLIESGWLINDRFQQTGKEKAEIYDVDIKEKKHYYFISRANDLQTLSGSLLSVELGLVNIFINDYASHPLLKDNPNNHVVYIGMPYIGLDIAFRQINKNIFYKDLPAGKEAGDRNDISATKNFWERGSALIGLTIGPIQNQNFSSLYSSFSLMTGFNYRFFRVCRIGTGVVLLKRVNANPLFNEKDIRPGFYLSGSLDLLFLGQSVQSFVKQIFTNL